MTRRHLRMPAGTGAPEPPRGLGPSSASATQGRRWRPDGRGAVARIGVMTPDFDPVPESEIWAMAPVGVSVHVSRVPWNSQRGRLPALAIEQARAFTAPPHVDRAVELLAAASPYAILYAFTSSSYVLEAKEEEALRARLERRGGGVPILLTCSAGVSALRVLGAKRVAVVHPPWFSAQLNARGKRYYQAHGFKVVLCAPMSPPRPFTEVPASELFDWARTNVPRQADAVFIAGNGLRAVGVIHALEKSLRRPVLTANQVLLWQALRRAGVARRVIQYGRIFRAGTSAP
jgi:maleate isomerase